MKFVVATVVVLCILASISAAKLNDNPSSFIVNSQDVADVVPFYGYLEIFPFAGLQGNVYFGGATLISTQVLVTVAQNVVGFGSWQVGLGATTIHQLQWHRVNQIQIHPLYNPNTLGNNIALLRLFNPITPSAQIAPINRSDGSDPFPGPNTELVIVGFGFGHFPEQPSVLQEAQLTTITQEACGNAYPHLIQNQLLNNHFCANNLTTLSNLCAGDQGGPIYSRDLKVMAGVQSFYRNSVCGNPIAQPGAFLRVHNYADFIDAFL